MRISKLNNLIPDFNGPINTINHWFNNSLILQVLSKHISLLYDLINLSNANKELLSLGFSYNNR